MTIREKLADWISGGEYSTLIHDNEMIIRNNRENARAMARKDESLRQIANATASGKSGTAKKIHRMATEALK